MERASRDNVFTKELQSCQIVFWLRENYRLGQSGSIPKEQLYADYVNAMESNPAKPAIVPTYFGKLVKKAFPNIRCNRKGPRGRAKQHYTFLQRIDPLREEQRQRFRVRAARERSTDGSGSGRAPTQGFQRFLSHELSYLCFLLSRDSTKVDELDSPEGSSPGEVWSDSPTPMDLKDWNWVFVSSKQNGRTEPSSGQLPSDLMKTTSAARVEGQREDRSELRAAQGPPVAWPERTEARYPALMNEHGGHVAMGEPVEREQCYGEPTTASTRTTSYAGHRTDHHSSDRDDDTRFATSCGFMHDNPYHRLDASCEPVPRYAIGSVHSSAPDLWMSAGTAQADNMSTAASRRYRSTSMPEDYHASDANYCRSTFWAPRRMSDHPELPVFNSTTAAAHHPALPTTHHPLHPMPYPHSTEGRTYIAHFDAPVPSYGTAYSAMPYAL